MLDKSHSEAVIENQRLENNMATEKTNTRFESQHLGYESQPFTDVDGNGSQNKHGLDANTIVTNVKDKNVTHNIKEKRIRVDVNKDPDADQTKNPQVTIESTLSIGGPVHGAEI